MKAGKYIVTFEVTHEGINRGSEVYQFVYVFIGSEKIVLEMKRSLNRQWSRSSTFDGEIRPLPRSV